MNNYNPDTNQPEQALVRGVGTLEGASNSGTLFPSERTSDEVHHSQVGLSKLATTTERRVWDRINKKDKGERESGYSDGVSATTPNIFCFFQPKVAVGEQLTASLWSIVCISLVKEEKKPGVYQVCSFVYVIPFVGDVHVGRCFLMHLSLLM